MVNKYLEQVEQLEVLVRSNFTDPHSAEDAAKQSLSSLPRNGNNMSDHQVRQTMCS